MATNLQHSTAPQSAEPLGALRRHWVLVLVAVIVFVAGAVALGLKRHPRYTATTNLSVGHVYVNSPSAIPTVIDATKSLASVYSRAIRSTAVMQDTRRRLAKKGQRVEGTVSATALPQSPLIKVSAEASSRAGAIALANAGGLALAGYVNGQVRDNGASAVLARRYRRAALAYRRALDRSDALAREYERVPTASNKAARDRAAAATDTALLRRGALQANYQAAVAGGTGSVDVDVFSFAGGANSDRWRIMQILVFVGLVGGVAAGAALALLHARGDTRRRRRA